MERRDRKRDLGEVTTAAMGSAGINLLLTALFTLVATQSVAGPSTWTGGGPEGGAIAALVVDPTNDLRVFAATSSNGVFVSNDAGASWSPAGDLEPPGLRALAIADDGVLYAATFSDGVVGRSADSGASWTTSGAGLPDDRYLAIAVAPTDSSRVLVGTGESGVLLSTDSGSTFGPVTGMTATRIHGLAFSPTNPLVAYAATNTDGVFWSTDGGATWSARNTGLPAASRTLTIDVDPSDANRILAYVRTSPIGMYLSTDAGATWSISTTGLTDQVDDVSIAPDDSTFILAATFGGIFRSTTGGASWSLASDLDGVRHGEVAVLPLPPRSEGHRGLLLRTVVAGSNAGAVRSTDSGDTWAIANSGLEANNCWLRLWASSDRPTELFCGEYQSDDAGMTWAVPVNPVNRRAFYGQSSLSNPARHYALGLDVFTTPNRGDTWSGVLADPTPFGSFGVALGGLAIHPTDENNIVVGNAIGHDAGSASGPAILRSTNGGANFTGLLTPFVEAGNFFTPLQIFIDPLNPDIIITTVLRTGPGVRSAEIWNSDSGGVSWNNELFPGASSVFLARSPSQPNTYYAAVFDDDGINLVIERSDLWAFDFNPVGAAPPCRGLLTVGPSDPDEVFLSCDELYRSTDGAMTWTALDRTGLPADVDEFIDVLVTDHPRRYVAATNAGVYEYSEILFADGFESGDTMAWSSTLPP